MSEVFETGEDGRLRRKVLVCDDGRIGMGVLGAMMAIGAGTGIDFGTSFPCRSREKRMPPPAAIQEEIISLAASKRARRAAKRLKLAP